jgi:hypothetical protein
LCSILPIVIISKNFTAASVSSSILRETFKVNLNNEVSELIPVCMSIA